MLDITKTLAPLLVPPAPTQSDEGPARFYFTATALATLTMVGLYAQRNRIGTALRSVVGLQPSTSSVSTTQNQSEQVARTDRLLQEYLDLIEQQNQHNQAVKQLMQSIADEMCLLAQSQAALSQDKPSNQQTHRFYASDKTVEQLCAETTELPFVLLYEAMNAYPDLERIDAHSASALTELIEANKQHHQQVKRLASRYLGAKYQRLMQLQANQLRQERHIDDSLEQRAQQLGITRV